MERSGDASTFEGLLGSELGTTSHESRHFDFCELDFETAEVSLRQVLDLVFPPGGGLLDDESHGGGKIGFRSCKVKIKLRQRGEVEVTC